MKHATIAYLALCMGGILTTGCGQMLGDVAWKSWNQSQAYWEEERDYRTRKIESDHNERAELARAIGGDEAHAKFTGATNEALEELRNALAVMKSQTESQAGLIGQLIQRGEDNDELLGTVGKSAGILALLGGGTGVGAVIRGRKKNGNGAPA